MGGRGFLVRRIVGAFATLAFVVSINFFLFRIMPGDPIAILVRQRHLDKQEQQEQLEIFGLDKPLHQQFGIYVVNTLKGDFGRSGVNGRLVSTMILERIWKTLILVGLGTIVSMVLGLLIGVFGGWRRGGLFDKTSLLGSLFFYSVPTELLGIVFIIVFAGILGMFPAGGYETPAAGLTGLAHVTDVFNHLVLPTLALGLGYLGSYSIVMRSSLLEVLGEDFIATARAKGLMENRVLWRHAVPNALLPSITLVLSSFGYVIGGSLITEWIFSYEGLGYLTASALEDQDFPVLQGIFLIYSASVIAFNLVADLLYGYLDPRVRIT